MDVSSFFRYATPVIYWLLILTWAFIFGFYILKVKAISAKDNLLRLLLIILAIDAFRSFFESAYFGFWYTSLSGLMPTAIFNFLQQPEVVFIPKMFNLITTYIIVTILLKKWFVAEINQKKELNDLVDAQNAILIHKNEELLQAKENAEESERRFKLLYENAPLSYQSLDINACLIDVNPTWLETLGYEREEVIGKPFSDFMTLESAELIKKEFSTWIEKGEIHNYEFEMMRKNGTRFMVSYDGKIGYDELGHFNKTHSIFTDITKRKLLEEKLLETSQFNQQIINGAHEGIIVYDKDLKYQVWNPFMEKLTGMPAADVLGKHPKDLFPFLASEGVVADIEKVLKGIESDGKEFPFYMPITNKGGWALDSRAPLYDYKGEIIGVITTVRDITEYKEFEIELLEAKEKAEESDRLKSAFLANMSHEIRTPMNGIIGFSELLKVPNLSGEEQKLYSSMIEKSGERMLNIINDIISISKIESGQMEVQIQESNMNAQIEYIYTFFKPELEAKGIQFLLKESLTFEEATIYTDREKVYAVLTNLVKNAIKFTEKGIVEFGYYKKDNFLEFYVKDSGIGIPKDRQQAIFERFIQADIADKMARQGAGLGLSISKAYVEMLGGQIWVESKENQGSVFYFTIPYLVDSKAKKESIININQRILEIPLKKLNILIVDDDETSSWLLGKMLKNLDKEILYAENGLEAVEICRNNPNIDLILMDMKMHIMDGYEATGQIRKFNNKSYIIAQTAFALEGDRERAIEAGCNEYISKPIAQKELLSMIKNHFDNQ